MGELRAVFFEGLATVPVGAALETTASFNLSIGAPNGAPSPRGTQRRTRHRRRVI